MLSFPSKVITTEMDSKANATPFHAEPAVAACFASFEIGTWLKNGIY